MFYFCSALVNMKMIIYPVRMAICILPIRIEPFAINIFMYRKFQDQGPGSLGLFEFRLVI